MITGASKTGKSAIIPIIDYCLGSDKCTIPVGPIRNACGWFGIVVASAQGQHLLARREPGDQQATGEMFLLERQRISIPLVVERNTSVDAVKTHLDELAGLTRLDFDFEGTGSGFRGRPSFRDMVAFVFQPQNIVANPSALFYKADSYEHREKLRTIFPYVLGAVTPEVLALQHEARRVQLEVNRKEREYKALSDVSQRWVAELRSRMIQARELGLLSEAPAVDTSLDQMLSSLRGVLEQGRPTRIELASITDAVQELVAVEREEAQVSSRLAGLRSRLAEMARLQEAGDEFKQTLEVKLDRLSLAEWMLSTPVGEKACPVCGSTQHADDDEVRELGDALKRVESEFGLLSKVPASFDREHHRVREEIATASEELEALRIRRHALVRRSDTIRERRFTEDQIARFLGALGEALNAFEGLSEDGELHSELEDLRATLRDLRRRVGVADVKRATDRALDRFALFAQRVVPTMDVERPDDPVRLSVDDLTLKIGGSSRDDYLWEIGSGANWVAYHIATMIALHQLFRELSQSPVPSFAVFDQPSQVYFPRPALARKRVRGSEADEEDDPLLRDEDIQAVRMIFSALSDATVLSGGTWQVIILDHAGESVWAGIPGVHLVEEWRDGRKLVPSEWLGHGGGST